MCILLTIILEFDRD